MHLRRKLTDRESREYRALWQKRYERLHVPLTAADAHLCAEHLDDGDPMRAHQLDAMARAACQALWKLRPHGDLPIPRPIVKANDA